MGGEVRKINAIVKYSLYALWAEEEAGLSDNKL
jgi:hypothetical protein